MIQAGSMLAAPSTPVVTINRTDAGSSCCGLTCVMQGNAGIVEGIGGEFQRVIPPGFTCLSPCTEKLGGSISFRTQYMETPVVCPTLDNATVRCTIGTVYRIIPALVHQAYYKLTATREQINSFVVANLRSEIRGIPLDGLFQYREKLAERLNAYLAPIVAGFGHEIVEILVLEVEPFGQVRDAINAQKIQFYARIAAAHEAETSQLMRIKTAEGNAEADRLEGVGQAEATKVVSRAMQEGLSGSKVDEATVMAMMLMLQYFDLIGDLAGSKQQPPLYFMPATGKDRPSFASRKRGGDQGSGSNVHQRKRQTAIPLDDI